MQEAYGNLPLHFEANQDQTDFQVQFLSRGPGYTLFLTPMEAVLALRSAARPSRGAPIVKEAPHATMQSTVLRMQLLGANPKPKMVGSEELAGKANYFIGKDPAKWRTNVPTYAKVQYRDLYPGIDLIYYGNQRQLEFDFIVAPGTNPNRIVLGFKGANRLEVDAQGDLVLHTANGPIRQQKPLIYQEVDGVQREIPGGYVLKGPHQVRFDVGAYDASRPLIIDPVLFYSTFLGGSGDDNSHVFGDIAVDAAGNAYVIGQTSSINFPTTVGALQTALAGGSDAFVAKLNPTGSGLLYSTYLGGTGGERGNGIAVDAAGNAYVTGGTDSADFPTTAGAYQTTYGGGNSDAFVAKLDPTGSGLVYSTYLGGSANEEGTKILVDASGSAYVGGNTFSTNFPTTAGAFQTAFGGGFSDNFVTKMNATGTGLVYSTYLGGNGQDLMGGLALDAAGSAYGAGIAGSTNFPTTPGAFQTAFGGGPFDAFVTKLNPMGSGLVYSTYLGGGGSDRGSGVAIDALGNAYAVGTTNSTNFPTTGGAFQTTFQGGNNDVFVTKVNALGTGLVYSSYLGGTGDETGIGIAVAPSFSAYLTGLTSSADFPIVNAVQSAIGGSFDAFVTKVNVSGSGLDYSTYLGGSSLDFGIRLTIDSFPIPNAYVTGLTGSADFPTTTGAFDTTHNGGFDAFVAKIADVLQVTIDIKPGSFPNSINLGSGGTVAVAIFSTASFDATTVDPLTVTLASAPVRLKGKGTPMASFQDVNTDGRLDLVVHVDTQAFELNESDTEAVLEGQTSSGMAIRGTDSVRVVP